MTGGLNVWLWQRLSAVYMALFLPLAGVSLYLYPPVGFDAWRELFERADVSIATALFFFALLLHAWIGIRDVLVDYVSVLAWRMLLQAVMSLALIAMGFWVLRVLWVTA